MFLRPLLAGCLMLLPLLAWAQADPDAAARIKAAEDASRAAAQAQAQADAAAQAQIDATAAEIERLKQEIAALQKDLTATVAQKQTLQSAIKALDLQIQTMTKSIALTNTQISQKDKEISRLSGNITTTSGEISESRTGVAESIRKLEQLDRQPAFTTFLAGGTLSDFFDETVTLSSMRSQLQNRIEDLSALKSDLQDSKTTEEGKRRELASLKAKLNQEKQGLAAARAEQDKLLKDTSNKESNYQKLIAQKIAEQEKFEQELRNYEAGLGLEVGAGSIPAARAGTLAWPLDSVRVTQYFGNTSFATQNPQIYGNKGHNAIDLAASTGSRVRSARSGVVLGTGNTDTTCPNASYGKWVFIKHDNGLSTLYAHLSVISVSQGESVGQGEVIGLSGNTGYSTGPHLHFGVYASAGSKIDSFKSSSCRGKTYTMPLADPSAYLNPLSYLPAR